MTKKNIESRRILEAPRRRPRVSPTGAEVVRYPVVYSPESIADINRDALPPPKALQGMELAYREEPDSEEDILASGRGNLAGLLLSGVAFSLVLVLLGPIIPVAATLSLSAVFVVPQVFMVIWSRQVTALRLVLATTGPPVIVLMLHAFAAILQYRTIGTVAFGLMSLVTIPVLVGSAFPFYFQLLLTDPRLRPSTRKKHQFQRSSIEGQTVLLLIGIVVAVGLVSVVSKMLGVAVALLSCATIAGGFNLKNRDSSGFTLPVACHYAIRLLSHYLYYGINPSQAAGVWYPTETVGLRQLKVISFLLPCLLTLASATAGFSMWDMPGSRDAFVTTFATSLHEEPTANFLVSLAPSADWNEFVASGLNSEQAPNAVQATPSDRESSPDEFKSEPATERQKEFLGNLLDSSPALWVVIAALGIAHGELWMLWIPVLSILAGLALSVLFPLAVLRPAFKACWQFETSVLPGLDNDQRPLWQCFVDRMRKSRHEHLTEEGSLIREQDHTFFGLSATTDYPVILHKPMFDEHCYIVGQTGSGKTALGIMPLLVQLIRGTASVQRKTNDT